MEGSVRLKHPHGQQTSLLTADDFAGLGLSDAEAAWHCVFLFGSSY